MEVLPSLQGLQAARSSTCPALTHTCQQQASASACALCCPSITTAIQPLVPFFAPLTNHPQDRVTLFAERSGGDSALRMAVAAALQRLGGMGFASQAKAKPTQKLVQVGLRSTRLSCPPAISVCQLCHGASAGGHAAVPAAHRMVSASPVAVQASPPPVPAAHRANWHGVVGACPGPSSACPVSLTFHLRALVASLLL